MENLPQSVMELAEETAKLVEPVHLAFPNGSSYSRYRIPSRMYGLHELGSLKVFRRSESFEIRSARATYYFHIRQILGPGVDLGENFHNRSSTGYKVELYETYEKP